VFHIFSALAEFERWANYRTDPRRVEHARKLVAEGERCEDVADLFEVGRTTHDRALAGLGVHSTMCSNSGL